MVRTVPERVPTRDVVLKSSALDCARAWAEGLLRNMAEEGRLVEGGWPGTLGEARARAEQDARGVLAREAMGAPSREELEQLSHLVYAEARRIWRASAVR